MPHAMNDSEGAYMGSCPICGKQGEERWRPFCSRRCADVDLHRWLSGSYAIPVAQADENEEIVEQSIDYLRGGTEAVDK